MPPQTKFACIGQKKNGLKLKIERCQDSVNEIVSKLNALDSDVQNLRRQKTMPVNNFDIIKCTELEKKVNSLQQKLSSFDGIDEDVNFLRNRHNEQSKQLGKLEKTIGRLESLFSSYLEGKGERIILSVLERNFDNIMNRYINDNVENLISPFLQKRQTGEIIRQETEKLPDTGETLKNLEISFKNLQDKIKTIPSEFVEKMDVKCLQDEMQKTCLKLKEIENKCANLEKFIQAGKCDQIQESSQYSNERAMPNEISLSSSYASIVTPDAYSRQLYSTEKATRKTPFLGTQSLSQGRPDSRFGKYHAEINAIQLRSEKLRCSSHEASENCDRISQQLDATFGTYMGDSHNEENHKIQKQLTPSAVNIDQLTSEVSHITNELKNLNEKFEEQNQRIANFAENLGKRSCKTLAEELNKVMKEISVIKEKIYTIETSDQTIALQLESTMDDIDAINHKLDNIFTVEYSGEEKRDKEKPVNEAPYNELVNECDRISQNMFNELSRIKSEIDMLKTRPRDVVQDFSTDSSNGIPNSQSDSLSELGSEVRVMGLMFQEIYECLSKYQNGILETKNECGKLQRQLKLLAGVDKKFKSAINLRPPSLQNGNVNCYLNSAIQSLLACDKFTQDIFQCYLVLGNEKSLENLHILVNLLQMLIGNNKVESRRFDIWRNKIFLEWNKSGQQDTFELMSFMLNAVFTQIRKYLEDSKAIQVNDLPSWLKIELPMRVRLSYQIKCQCGHSVFSPLQTDIALHIPIKDNLSKDRRVASVGLQDLVDDFFNDESVEGHICENPSCPNLDSVKHSRIVKPLPRTLCIHLQKTYWDGHKMRKVKSRVTFQDNLTIKSSFIRESVSVTQSPTKESPKTLKVLKGSINTTFERLESLRKSVRQNANEQFQLKSVIVHDGTAKSGHYRCYSKYDQTWYLTDDTIIQPVSDRDVACCDPYVLFYEKKDDFTSST